MLQAGRCATYARLRAAADGILAAAAQIALFDLPPPTEEEVATLSKFERMVEKLTAICNDGIQENEVVVLRKVNPDRAATVVQQLGLIRADLARMERALQGARCVACPKRDLISQPMQIVRTIGWPRSVQKRAAASRFCFAAPGSRNVQE